MTETIALFFAVAGLFSSVLAHMRISRNKRSVHLTMIIPDFGAPSPPQQPPELQ